MMPDIWTVVWIVFLSVVGFVGSQSAYRMGLCDGWNAHRYPRDSLYNTHRKIIRRYHP